MRNIVECLVLCVALSFFIGCSSNEKSGKPVVVVSVPPQKTLIEEIVGDKMKVVCLTNSDVNPESFEPAMNSMVQLDECIAYFPLGILDFERQLMNRIESENIIPVFPMSEGVALIYGTHDDDDDHLNDSHHHYEHGAPDPHIWTSFRNMRVIAGKAAEHLAEIDPDNGEAYKKNFLAIDRRLDSLDNNLKLSLDTVRNKTFIVWHPSLSYFARDYGFDQIVVGSHSKEMSVQSLHGKIKKASDRAPGVFFIQNEFDSKNASTVSEMIGTEFVEIAPMSPDWEDELIKIADVLQQ